MHFLLLQRKTMEMMYDTIYKALKEVGLDNKYEPQDYLNFFCLGNREVLDGEDSLKSGRANGAKTAQVCLGPISNMYFDYALVFIVPRDYFKSRCFGLVERALQLT